MIYQVYILYSEEHDRFYIGQTADLDARLIRHNSKMEKATKPYCPWVLRFSIEKETRSGAMILENKLKNLNKIRLIQFMKKYQSNE